MRIRRGISAGEFVSAIEADGFVNTRTEGSHHWYEHPDGRRTSVSYHKRSDTFPIGTLKGMIADARWTEEDLRRHRLLQ